MILAAGAYLYCHTNCHAAPKGAGVSVQFVPHAAAIIGIALCLGVWSLLPWLALRKCKCEERGTFLRPNWRRYGKKK